MTYGDVAGSIVADRMISYSLHIVGERAAAQIHVERMLSRYEPPVSRSMRHVGWRARRSEEAHGRFRSFPRYLFSTARMA